MSIEYKIMGQPGRDNALLTTVDTGQSLHRLLFDCGEGSLDGIPVSHRQDIEAVFFSHFHIDHIAGFDSLLRFNWCRPDVPLRVFGPEGTIELIHHRLQGFTWDLVEDLPGEWHVSEITDGELRTSRFLTCEGFAYEHPMDNQPHDGIIYESNSFQVTTKALSHSTTSLAYVVQESDRTNVDMAVVSELGFQPGPWLRTIKDTTVDQNSTVQIDGADHRVGDLRDKLLTTTSGESLAYLTDFYLDGEAAEDDLVEFLSGCQTVVCENNYSDEDLELARKNYHMTSSDVARLAKRVQPDRLILFHLSDRYTLPQWQDQLERARQHFAQTHWPADWEELNTKDD